MDLKVLFFGLAKKLIVALFWFLDRDTTVDALNTFVCETGTGKHVPRALFIVLEPTVAVMVR